jgi:hypothetical protein
MDTSLLPKEARQKTILLVTEGWNATASSVKIE